MLPGLESAPLTLVAAAVIGYLLGSIPFGMVLARIMGLGNLREIGSGNIGATNVLRTGNKLAAFLTLALDAGKGAVAVVIARQIAGEDAAQIAGLAAFLGHLYPVWLGFRGGKGVATFLGLTLALGFWAGLAACATWLVVAVVFRYSSLSALAATALTPVWLYILGTGHAAGLALVLAIIVWLRHRENIQRLISGQESKIGKKG